MKADDRSPKIDLRRSIAHDGPQGQILVTDSSKTVDFGSRSGIIPVTYPAAVDKSRPTDQD
ncbi:MAG: hypothetical protein ACO331_10165 [Prochlorothrix sp.]